MSASPTAHGYVTPRPSIFGPIVSGGDVETWTLALLKRWISTYLAETERQHSIPAGQTPRPKGWALAPSFDKWPEDQIPGIIVISTGTSEAPIRDGGGYYRARWRVDVGAACSTRTQDGTRAQARLYASAIRDLLVQRASLDGHTQGTVWLGETYQDLAFDDTRSLASATVQFTIEVDEVALANAGPTLPDVPDDQPWPDWQDVESAHVDVNQTTVPGTPGGLGVTVISNGQVVETPPVEPPPDETPTPVLTQLVPDFAGDWDVELHAIGSNFTSESVIVGGGVVAFTTFISSTELSAVVPGIVAPGAYPVVVRTGTKQSQPLTFTAL